MNIIEFIKEPLLLKSADDYVSDKFNEILVASHVVSSSIVIVIFYTLQINLVNFISFLSCVHQVLSAIDGDVLR